MRIWQHQNSLGSKFTTEYKIHRLVWYEPHEFMESAIKREKQLKHWNRNWKIRLIGKLNPNWNDLSRHTNPFA